MKKIRNDLNYINNLKIKYNIPEKVAKNIALLHEVELMILEAYNKNNYSTPYASDYLDSFYMELDDFVSFEDNSEDNE